MLLPNDKTAYKINVHVRIHVLMRDEKEERKKQARSNKQTGQSNTATQHTQARKNELPRVRLKPTTLYTCTLTLYFPIDIFSVLIISGEGIKDRLISRASDVSLVAWCSMLGEMQ